MGAMKKSGAAFDLDFVLGELGQFGRYQLYNYALIVVPIMFSAIYGANYVFTAADLDYRCRIPECEGSDGNTFNHSWLDYARPNSGNGMRCSRFEPLNTTSNDDDACSPEFFHNNRTLSCDDWVYASKDTIVHTFQLACEDWKRTLVGTVHSAGLLAALPITGYVSDRFGRKFAFILCSINAGVFGLIRSFSPNYEFYIVFEFLEATLGSGVYSAGFILALELVGFKKRVLGGNIISMFYAVGQVILALVAWVIPEWRTLTRVLYAPSVLFILYFYVIQESVRWLLSKGKNKEAIHILIRAAKINKVYFSKQVTSQFDVEKSAGDNAALTSENEPEELKAKSLVTQVIKSPIILSRLFICSFWWITVTFVYYGLSINVTSLLGNFYVNYILVSLVEIPGYILSVFVLDRFGRKKSLMTGFLICGLANIVLPFVPDDFSWFTTCLYLLGKMTISMCFSSIYIYTSELFPTNARHSLLGFCSMLGRIGSMVAPQMPLLSIYMDSLPSLLFGAFAVTAGLLMLATPETLNIKLPDSIAEAEDISKLKIEDPNSKTL